MKMSDPVCFEGIPEYACHKQLGKGTYGQVCQAEHKTGGKIVAIKHFAPIKVKKPKDESDTKVGIPAYVLREKAALSCTLPIDSAHVIRSVHDHSDPTGSHAVIMDKAETNMHHVKLIIGGFSDLLKVWEKMALSVLTFHMHGLMHRDIKPDNFLVFPKTHTPGIFRYGPDDFDIKLSDFNSVHKFALPAARESRLSHINTTVWFRAPELMFNTTSHTAMMDVWSLGIAFWEMLFEYGANNDTRLKLDVDDPTRSIHHTEIDNGYDFFETDDIPDLFKRQTYMMSYFDLDESKLTEMYGHMKPDGNMRQILRELEKPSASAITSASTLQLATSPEVRVRVPGWTNYIKLLKPEYHFVLTNIVVKMLSMDPRSRPDMYQVYMMIKTMKDY